MEKDTNKTLLTLLETQYIKNKNELPIEWYQNNNIELKLETISKAINEDKSIEEIEGYKDIYNEVHDNNNINRIKR